MNQIESLENTIEIAFDEEKAKINILENTFVTEDGKGEDDNAGD